MKPKYKIEKKYLIKKYIKELKTISEIAKEIGCNNWVIKDRMKKYNVKIRTHGQTKRLRGTYKKEKNPAWKGEKPKCPICGKRVSTHSTTFCSKHRPVSKNRNGMWTGGLPKCMDCGKQLKAYGSIRCSHCAKIGKLHARWTGLTPLARLIRNLSEYKWWRMGCLHRDNLTCQECGSKYLLEAHHKKPFVELLLEFLYEYNQFSPIEDKETLVRLAMKWQPFWDVDNGKTLCRKCHDLTKSGRLPNEI